MDGNQRTTLRDASVGTPAPNPLLVMLCDRLILDVRRGVAAIESGDCQESHNQLIHAHDIVLELLSSPNTEDWVAPPGLAGLYDRLQTQLVRAAMSKDVRIALSCLDIATDVAKALDRTAVTPLRQTAAAS